MVENASFPLILVVLVCNPLIETFDTSFLKGPAGPTGDRGEKGHVGDGVIVLHNILGFCHISFFYFHRLPKLKVLPFYASTTCF